MNIKPPLKIWSLFMILLRALYDSFMKSINQIICKKHRKMRLYFFEERKELCILTKFVKKNSIYLMNTLIKAYINNKAVLFGSNFISLKNHFLNWASNFSQVWSNDGQFQRNVIQVQFIDADNLFKKKLWKYSKWTKVKIVFKWDVKFNWKN